MEHQANEYSFKKSKELYDIATQFIPGGVSSVNRGPAGGIIPGTYPMFFERASGSHIYDADGNDYVDYVMGFGPIILGHCHPKVVDAVVEQARKGEIYGMSCELEYKVAEKIVKGVPCADKVFFANTGSEATSLAVRLARVYTGRSKILKFEGAYHGWHDWCMVDSVTQTLALGAPKLGGPKISPLTTVSEPGVPTSILSDILIAPWNDLEALESILTRNENQVAAVVVEPAGPWGVAPPEKGFLEGVRKITEEKGALLIYDEVRTGFRYAFGGAQEFFGVKPDLAAFGKALANGFQVAAVAGVEEVMATVISGRLRMPIGTFTGHPVCMAASYATLTELEGGGRTTYEKLFGLGNALINSINDSVEDMGIQALVQGFGPEMAIMFTHLDKIRDMRDFQTIKEYPHNKRAEVFRLNLVKRGVFATHHPWFISLSHSEEDIRRTVSIVEESLREAKKIG